MRATGIPIAILSCSLLAAQTANQTTLSRQAQDLVISLSEDDLGRASEIADQLDDGIQRQYRATLVRDSGDHLKEILGLLPLDTENLLVLREPFTIHAPQLAPPEPGHLVQVVLVERLAALSNGKIYTALDGRTVRFAASGRNATDGVWFYFLGTPPNPDAFGTPDEKINGTVVWSGIAEVPRNKETWFALPRRDLLVMASSKEGMSEVLSRFGRTPESRALPSYLPEWAQMDLSATAFGLRHGRDSGATFAWDSADRDDSHVITGLARILFGRRQ